MTDVFQITHRPLSVDAAMRAVRTADCGAIALFVGTVRDQNAGRRVRRMRYSAYGEMAEKEFRAIALAVRRRWEIGQVYIAHRTGMLRLTQASVVIAISAPHRAEAFAACRYAIERLKKKAPIWKEEFYARGKAWISS